ncbi:MULTISPECIES: ABC transporter substrate-binding protein [Pseudonocardia]|uniref:Peptide-binding protein n=2 Tax=Pseudonocardia TaxID=1847 RepID=A0ABQ0S9X5_9PSEU|nr:MULTISPECIES: ABC transporter substrate-binding protein [Pseudonocardia]OSY34466.1 putative D,D-dipeptide-binding periplasmic protein DdpA precursor [Pseudonocardia autotrophica]TDN72639.1 peptide/nickel transport system substrate-binding protein [Pseudonocardia autotrophica]BBG03351.1 peptide-binding protein [Pseudonocardia autotrophica]GEC29714.1 peptide-binding protein [Pseudonocardia saturnea]
MSTDVRRPVASPTRRRVRTVAAVLALLVVASCSSAQDAGSDTAPITVGQTSVLDVVDPMSTAWDLTAAGVAESVYTSDRDGTLSSRFVESATRDDALDWTLELRDGVLFSDGSPVDAAAFADAMNRIQTENSLATASTGGMTFTPEGDAVAVRTTRPTMVMESVLAEWTNVVFKGDAAGGFVFTGPYAVGSLRPKEQLDLVPNTHYAEAASRGPVGIRSFADADAMRLAIQSGSIDMAFTITPEVARQLQDDPSVTVSSIEAGYQYFSMLNEKVGATTDLTVRQALDLGLDRQAYVDALLGGRVATGAFAHTYSFAGDLTLGFDPAEAGRILDRAGWVRGADGMRAKDGEPLSLSLVTYTSRPDLSIIMQIMVSQLKDLGIASTTSVTDDIRERLAASDWNAAVYAQHTAPTAEPSYFLNQFLRTGAANNFTGYSSPTTDGLLDRLGTLPAGAERDDLARQIQRQVHTDLPLLFQVDPQWHIATTERLASYRPYGGDYYVINPELGLS